MSAMLNHYRCPACMRTWRCVKFEDPVDDCASCHASCLPCRSEVLRLPTFTCHCRDCGRDWEGPGYGCRCGASRERLEVSVRAPCG